MDSIGNKENNNPKSLGRIGYNTTLKGNIPIKKNVFSKNQKLVSRTPLKSNLNIMNINQKPFDIKDKKPLQYPLLKSVSSSNINIKNNKNFINNNIEEGNDDDNDYDEKYNENALEDEPEDFMHMNEDKIILINDNEYDDEMLNDYLFKKKELNVEILNEINPFANYKNNYYALGAHFDEKGKKEYDDYFKSPDPDEDDLDEDI